MAPEQSCRASRIAIDGLVDRILHDRSIWYAVETPDIPLPMMTTSLEAGSSGVDRCESRGCSCVRQKGLVDAEHGNVAEEGSGVCTPCEPTISDCRGVGEFVEQVEFD